MEDPPAPGENQRSSEEFESLFSSQAALASYKQRSEEFKKLFKDVPEAELLVMDFTCALQRDILLQGRLYLSQHWLCFHSNVFWGTTLMVALKDITAMSREKTAKIIPNAIQICTEAEKLFFTSFSGREKSFQGIFQLWQNSVANKPLTERELRLMVRHHYGDELELSSGDMDGVQVTESGARASMSTRAGGEDPVGRAERPSSLRIAQAHATLGNRSSPVRDETQSSLAVPSLNAEDSCSHPSRHKTPDVSLDRMIPERVLKPSDPSVVRTVQEKSPKASEASLDRNASERGSRRYEASVDRSASEKGSRRYEASVDRSASEKGSRRYEVSVDRSASEKGSRRYEVSVDRSASEKGSKRYEASLDQSASEKGSRLYEASLDRSAAVRGSKRLEASVDQTASEKSSSRSEPAFDRTTPERGSKRSNAPLDHSAAERGSKQSEMSLETSAQEQLAKWSNFPLELNDNDDVSNYSSSEGALEEEHLCPSQVEGRVFVNRVFHMSAEKMFELLFTDSPFVSKFMAARKVTGSTATAWQKDGSGSLKRALTYTVTITNPLVGKSSRATETQVLYKMREAQHYMVDTEVFMHDVPYHDYFYTFNRYCIIHNSKRKCRLRIHTDVKYKKQPWGLAKSFITKNSWSGLEEYFRHLEAELLDEEVVLTQGPGDLSKAGGLRRRRRAYSRSLPEHFKPSKQYPGDVGQRRESLAAGGLDTMSPKRWNLSTIVAAMSFLLLLLTLLNLGLFFKLWAMEDVAQRMYLSTKQRLQERPRSSLDPDLGSRPLPPNRSKEDIQLLRTVLEESIQLLEQLRSSLVVLQHIFQVRNDTSPHR